jgi:hypothetical protein
MPLDPTNFHPNGPVASADMRQFYDLFTGAMADQPVTFRNVATVGGNQGITTVPFKIYGSPGQNTNLIDLYPDRSSSQPGFGIGASGQFGWGPGGTAPQDTHMSRIGNQNGHTDNAAGLYVVPALELLGDMKVSGSTVITGDLTAGTLSVSGGGLGTIGATRINFSPTAFIMAYPSDNTYILLPKLTVTPGTTSLAGVTVNGTSQMNGAAAVTGGLTVSNSLNVASGSLSVPGGNISTGGALNAASGSFSASLYAATTIQAGGRVIANGYDAGASWGGNFGGNVIASGFFYQRANGGARCWDNLDFTYGVGIAASTLVQRDGSGQIQAQSVYMPSGAQGGKPTYVCGQNNDGYMRWWPTNAIGPPISAWYAQANMTLPPLSSSGSVGDATFGAVAVSGGFGVSGVTITVPRPGYYSVAGGFNGWNNTGNTETMSVNVISSGHGTLDSIGVPLRIESYFGGYFTWEGYLDQGETIRVRFQTSFDAISGNGEILVSFVPTAQYNQ